MNNKKLYRSTTNQMLAGVCGGLAEYIGMDPTIVRIICAVLCLAWGAGLLLYIICAIIIPKAE